MAYSLCLRNGTCARGRPSSRTRMRYSAPNRQIVSRTGEGRVAVAEPTAREGHAVDGARRARRTSEPTGRAGRAAVAEPTGRTGLGDHARWFGWFLPPLPRRAWRVMSLSLSFRRSTFRSAPAPNSAARRCALQRVTSQKRRTRQCHLLRDHTRARNTNRRHACDGDDHDPPVTATPTTTATTTTIGVRDTTRRAS